MKEFDRKAIEAAHKASVVKEEWKPDYHTFTVAQLEAITWPLVVGDNLKATDEQGDLVSLLVENDKIVYDHMSNRQEWQAGVIHFELPFNNEVQEEPAQEEVTE